ncbi:MAG: hypothetical protein Q4F95_15010 [Oscillospiraceae bacterium]|nr:hypothetical protein [Oscillospiraceae bacterium]
MNKDYEYITAQSIESGMITIPPDNFRAWKEVTDYNNHMSDLRFKKKELRLTKDSFIITDILIVFALVYSEHLFITRPVLSLILSLFYCVYIIIFPFQKRFDIVPNTAASLIWLILDIRFLVLTLFSFVVCVLYKHIDGKLRNEDGYPDFFDIELSIEDKTKK